jgi:hypothetical protein
MKTTAQTVRKIPAEIYSRVVGYYSPVKQWNPGKLEELSERKIAEEIKRPVLFLKSLKCDACGADVWIRSRWVAQCTECDQLFLRG